MPRKTIDYGNTVIYRICCKDLENKDTYVGHTTNFTSRKAQHKLTSKSEGKLLSDTKLYSTIRANGGWANWDMVVVEKWECQNHQEACSRERHWCETLNANLNSVIPDSQKYDAFHARARREKELALGTRDLERERERARAYSAYYRANFKEIRANQPDYSADGAYIPKTR